jgi:hypothetical protein
MNKVFHLEISLEWWELPTVKNVKPIFADAKKRLTLPAPVKPNSAWVPVLVTESEMHFIRYEGPKAPDLDTIVADTWEKLGPAPEVDYDQL